MRLIWALWARIFQSLQASWIASGTGSPSVYDMWLVDICQWVADISGCPQISLDAPKHLQMPTGICRDLQVFANKVRFLELSSASSGLRHMDIKGIPMSTKHETSGDTATSCHAIYFYNIGKLLACPQPIFHLAFSLTTSASLQTSTP